MTDFQYKQVLLLALAKAEAAVKDALTDDPEQRQKAVNAINQASVELIGRDLHEKTRNTDA